MSNKIKTLVGLTAALAVALGFLTINDKNQNQKNADNAAKRYSEIKEQNLKQATGGETMPLPTVNTTGDVLGITTGISEELAAESQIAASTDNDILELSNSLNSINSNDLTIQ